MVGVGGSSPLGRTKSYLTTPESNSTFFYPLIVILYSIKCTNCSPTYSEHQKFNYTLFAQQLTDFFNMNQDISAFLYINLFKNRFFDSFHRN